MRCYSLSEAVRCSWGYPRGPRTLGPERGSPMGYGPEGNRGDRWDRLYRWARWFGPLRAVLLTVRDWL
ncbi:hypothetical protein GCM10010507_38050 [Streptomyces cinnamoneus]|uniref:Uncharacterized protein n=1 Tax=Streptomyces cinnamoneus TaxID=53446 RepID=A0A918TQQ6_STRCJ|nr:hypothetical protein GCM10010507_38050 [Streptomyces cinnamoneus]